MLMDAKNIKLLRPMRTPTSNFVHFIPYQLQPQLTIPRNSLDLGEVPLLVAQRADAPRPEPPLDAVEVEDVPAVPERDAQPVVVRRAGVGLILDARLVQGIPADRDVSAQMSHDHMATAFHFLISKRGGGGGAFPFFLGAGSASFALGFSAAASDISTSLAGSLMTTACCSSAIFFV
eukprot:CAMPEP_0113541508 /NCGR_PEP_ID=MMETSP0015_2-20120614/9075_1 /TAXON_ID=2838 /ORGANISM="Odontella" /LENGTH=176 /DNA_ID=CAMNT_0000441431 /DNA_START=378 /DNA_END=910 /DNA_ORIENTATION=- /assembly_acc=CAM_ASM_000160